MKHYMVIVETHSRRVLENHGLAHNARNCWSSSGSRGQQASTRDGQSWTPIANRTLETSARAARTPTSSIRLCQRIR